MINAVEAHHGDVEPENSDRVRGSGGRYDFCGKTGCEKRNIGNIYKQV